ncbi:Uncharacterised protein [Clostridioides difficile]|nr:Uncharacterised protein [Clostridioides difficile]
MKKLLLIIIILLSIYGCTNNKSIKNNSSTNKKNTIQSIENKIQTKSNIEDARNFENSLSNGSVMMISTNNSPSLEVYNIQVLDKFIDSFNNGTEGYVRIIKGKLIDNKFLVNKLEELECYNHKIKLTPYDPYSDKDKFIQGKTNYFIKIVKLNIDDGVKYTLLTDENTPNDMGLTLISFDKTNIKN